MWTFTAGKRLFTAANSLEYNMCCLMLAGGHVGFDQWKGLWLRLMQGYDSRMMKLAVGDDSCRVLDLLQDSVWKSVSRQRVFDFLIETRLRSEWDSLSIDRDLTPAFKTSGATIH
ncbi:hypothetical protein KIW84_045988 [Lathyrus oleraceus]|uniref:Uncharacterized protein n=1 Tax=Pisum sativum TaxID=3888 RepID=A0A9D5AUW6_PEA|nr:hypothetical protein KIW84_045988 [Pisum sativum]